MSSQTPNLSSQFSVAGFDSDAYVRNVFKSSNEGTILEHKQALENEKEIAASKLKTSVFKNYPQFIEASNEIANMEANLLRLRNLLSEIRTVVKNIKTIEVKAGSWKSTDKGPVMPDRDQRKAILEEAQWAFDSLYDLDGAIAERRFDEAMDLVNTIRQNTEQVRNPTVVASVSAGVAVRIALLADRICENLNDAMISTDERTRYVTHLTGLGQIERARDIFFESRSKWIKQRIRSIKLQGDVSEYARELSRLVVSAISITCDDFKSTFPNPLLISSFVVWASRELELFSKYFAQQVFHGDNFRIVGDCLDHAYNTLAELEKKGLGLVVVVKRNFLSHLMRLTEAYIGRMQAAALQKIETDKWKGRDLASTPDDGDSEGNIVKLTDSAKYLFVVSQKAVAEIGRLLTSELYTVVDKCMSQTFDEFAGRLAQCAYGGSLSDAQFLSIAANVFYMAEDLLPRVGRQLQRRFERPMFEMEKTRRRLLKVYGEIRDSYATQRAQSLVMDHLRWVTVMYPPIPDVELLLKSPSLDKDDLGIQLKPSTRFVRLLEFLSKLRQSITQFIGEHAVTPTLSLVAEETCARLDSEPFWELNRTISRSGLHSLIVDIRFLLVSFDRFCTDEVMQFAEVVVEKAVIQFCTANEVDPRQALLSDEWFDIMANRQLESMSVSLRDPLPSIIFPS